MISGAQEWCVVLAPLVAPVVLLVFKILLISHIRLISTDDIVCLYFIESCEGLWGGKRGIEGVTDYGTNTSGTQIFIQFTVNYIACFAI